MVFDLMVPVKERGVMGKKKDERNRWVEILVLAILAIVVVMLMLRCSREPEKPDDDNSGLTVDVNVTSIGSGSGGAVKKEAPMFTATGYFDKTLGYGDFYPLVNDRDNSDAEIYVRYLVSVDGREVFSSGLVEQGMQVNWVPAEVLEEGEYEVLIREVPFIYDETAEEWVEKYAAEQKVRIKVER